MGRTLPTANMAALQEEGRWRDYRRALRREDQAVFDLLWGDAKRQMQASQNAGTLIPFHAILLSMLLEMRKENLRLNDELEKLKDSIGRDAPCLETERHPPSDLFENLLPEEPAPRRSAPKKH